jgi:uncharacterized coiled-coil DUF342 family protein
MSDEKIEDVDNGALSEEVESGLAEDDTPANGDGFSQGIEGHNLQDDFDKMPGLLKEVKDLNDKLEVLMPSILQSAEASTETAEISRQSSISLHENSNKLERKAVLLAETNERQNLTSWRIVSGAAGALLVALGLFAFMSVQLADRVVKVDAMIVAVSKRVVEMNAALDELSDLNASINEVSVDQRRLSSEQANFVASLNSLKTEVGSLSTSLPNTTANSVEEKTTKFVSKIEMLASSVDSQSSAISSATLGINRLDKKIEALESELQGVKKLNRSVTALVALEREDYISVLREQTEVQKERLAVEAGIIDDPKIVTFPKR